MTRKDYEMLARVVRQLSLPNEARKVVASELAQELHNHFANFQRQRFVEACE